MKHVAITGATSMIGVALIKECLSHGVKVTALVRPGTRRIHRLPNSKLVEVVPCSLDQMSACGEKGLNCDTFYHCAWKYTLPAQRVDPSLQSENIPFTQKAVALAERLGSEQFIFVGSQAEYGRCKGVISPETPTRPETAYGIAKHCAGSMSQLYCGQLGMKHQWGRIFSVYGYYDNHFSLIHSTIDLLLKGQQPTFTPCEQIWDYMFCDDAGKALYLMGERGTDGSVYCIASGQARALYEYVAEIGKVMNVDLLPAIGRKPYVEHQVMELKADIRKLVMDTGFSPTVPFHEGIERTVRWQRERMI